MSPLEGRLSWSGRVPVQWHLLDALPDEAQLGRAAERNAALLNALTLVEEGVARHSDDTSPLAAHMDRLEAKFDLVLNLLTEVLLPDAVAPTPVPVRLCSRGLVFEVAYPAPPGSAVELNIYFSASLPRPVRLYGVVVEPQAGEEDLLSVEFHGIEGVVKDRLERLVFRRHRRSIAKQRPQAVQPAD